MRYKISDANFQMQTHFKLLQLISIFGVFSWFNKEIIKPGIVMPNTCFITPSRLTNPGNCLAIRTF